MFSKIDLKEEGISMEEMIYFLKPLGNFKAFEIEKEELRNKILLHLKDHIIFWVEIITLLGVYGTLLITNPRLF